MQQSNQINKAGNELALVEVKNKVEGLTTHDFLEKKWDRIDTIDPNYLRSIFGVLFTRIAFLSGVKEEIDDINKADIKKMMITRYREMSIEEIWKAFELERFGEHEETTQHFQLFNAEYVGAVIKKFKKWRAAKRVHHGMVIDKKIPLLPQQTDHSYEEMMQNAVKRLKLEYENTNDITGSNDYVYTYLFDKNELPTGMDYKKEVMIRAKEIAVAEVKKKPYQSTTQNIIDQNIIKRIRENKDNTAISIAKSIVLKEYFNKQQNGKLE